MINNFKNKNILVTGGTGSIGSEIVRQLLKFSPKVVRVFARHEDRHHTMMQELGIGSENNLRFIVGDVRDKERLEMAMAGIDIVFHAAALKHVPLCEYNPFEAVKTNIIGTQNVIEMAREANVEQVIGISTDKAAEPEGVLGVSKLMAEKLFLATFFYKGDKSTKFSCVRFGNVLGSRGSILPVIKKQIFDNKEITITDPEMTRFFMTIPQAVNLVLNSATHSLGQEIFVLKMPSVKIGDLVKAAIEYYAPLAGKKPSQVKIKHIGKRDGEKQHEKLLASHEMGRVLDAGGMYILTPHEKIGGLKYLHAYPGAVKIKNDDKEFLSEHAIQLTHSQLIDLVKEVDLHQA